MEKSCRIGSWGYERPTAPNVADSHPEVVSDLRMQLEEWREMTRAQRVTPDGEGADISPEEMEQLRTSGYMN